MATLLDPKIDHIECFISDADLFTPAFVQSDIQSGRYEDIDPITKLEDNQSSLLLIMYHTSFWI